MIDRTRRARFVPTVTRAEIATREAQPTPNVEEDITFARSRYSLIAASHADTGKPPFRPTDLGLATLRYWRWRVRRGDFGPANDF